MKSGRSTSPISQDYSFISIFEINEIQRLQDLFSDANEVASIITKPDGTPITKPSNFCRLCSDFIRKSEKGICNCFKSDAEIGKHNLLGPTVKKCLSGGLWDAGVSITVGGVHIANWLIGQVRNKDIDEEAILKYSDEIGVNRKDFLNAYHEVPEMSSKKFQKIAEMLFVFVNEISEKAFNNLQLKKEIENKEKAIQQKIEKERELITVNNEIKIISENLPNVIWKADLTLDGKFENAYISEIADEILGLPAGTINNSFDVFFSYIVPEQISLLQETIAKGIANPGKVYSVSYQVIKKNNELAWFESTGRGYVYDNKIQIFGVTADITEQKRIEDKLKVNEYLLTQSQKMANIGSYILDLESESWICTPVLAEIFGIDDKYEKTISGWLQIIHPDDRQMMQEHFFSEVLSQSQPFNKEYRIKKINDGQEIWVHGMGELEFDKLGNPVKMIGTIRNINSQKQVDASLLESEDRYRTLLANLPVGVFRSTIQGKVLSANPAMAEIYGYNSVEELLNIPAANYYAGSNPRQKMLNELQVNGYLLDYQTQEYKKDGSLIWVSANYKLIKVNQEEIYIDGVLIDITERKNAEFEIIEAKAKAEESQERFELAMGVTLDGPYDWNLVTNEIYFSPRWKEILGYKPDELPNDFSVWEKLTHPVDVKKSWEMLRQHIEGDINKFEMEFKMLHKNGHWVDILSRAMAHFDENGKAVRIVGTHIDISETKKTEKQLKENEERFRKLTEHLPSGIAIYQPVNNGNDFRFVDVNKKAEVITNTSREKLIGQTLLDKFPNMLKSPLYDALQKVNSTGEDVFIPSFYYKDSVREGWRENYIYRLQSGEIVAIFRDTTEIKNAEQNLIKQNAELINAKLIAEQNETRFKALHDASFGGIAIHDKGIILDCNQGLSKLSGFSHEELIGMDGLLLIEESSRKKVMDNILAEFENPYETLALRKNGEIYPVRLEGRMIPYKGKKVRVVEFRDITEIKQTEAELILAKEKAEESDRLKSAFLANMSHEIRTPMNGILGFTSLLQEPGLTGEEQQTYIDIIQKSGDRMLNTVNDIIEVSKIETEQVSVVLKEINVNRQMKLHFDFFTPEALQKGLQMKIESLLPDEESGVFLDENKFDSILTNLIKNAIKYSEKGTIRMGCKQKEKYIEFWVKDDGIGVPLNRQKAIFDRFVQADIEDTRAHQGSGLGLTIVKSYVQMLGGNIWVESEVDKGSSFYFTIEYKPSKVSKKMEVVPEPRTFKNIDLSEAVILVAEDDEVSFILLEDFLVNENCKLIHAKNGKEAVDICQANPNIDLVLMDIKMPVLDGIEATKKIREFNKTIPIIAQTAYALAGDKELAIVAGCNDYISKPINKEVFKSKLFKLLKEK